MPKTTALVQMGLFNFALAKVFNIIMQTKRTMLQAVDRQILKSYTAKSGSYLNIICFACMYLFKLMIIDAFQRQVFLK